MLPAAKTSLRLLALVASFTLSANSLMAEKNLELPLAKEVIELALKRANWLKEQKIERKYTFYETVSVEKLSPAKTVIDREKSRYAVYPVRGVLFRRLILKNSQPLSPTEVATEDQKEQDLREQLRLGRKLKENENRVEFNRDLVNRFRIKLVSQKLFNGRSTYILQFEPKNNRLPVRRRMDYALNKSIGHLMIDEETYEVARVEFHLIKPVKILWGFLGKLLKVTGSLERQPSADGYWAPTKLNTYVHGRVLFSSSHQRRQTEWEGYRRWPTASPTGKSAW